MIRIQTVALDGNVYIQTDVFVYHPEGNRLGSTVLIAYDLLCIYEIHSLILTGVSAEGKSATEGLEAVFYAFAEASAKDRGLGGFVIGVFSCFGTKVYDSSLLYDDHALTLINGDNGAV